MTTASAHGPSLRPVIGICAAYEVASWGAWTMDAGIIASTYLTHLAHSDAVPLALVPSEATIAEAETIVSRLDGLLLLGGADVSPEFYGAVAVPELEATIPFRDRTEIALVHAAMAIDIPIFGVCRGLHLLNVATGGTLRQDIGDLAPQRHRRAFGRLDVTTMHDISVPTDSELARAIGAGTQTVNSHHHQAVDRLGSGARVSAVSTDDGIIEALEWPEFTFAVGVQWHPEAMEPGGIFARFFDVARQRMTISADSE